MKIAIIIPARMQSTRFPGKPLAKILGLPMIEHVRRRCLLARGIDDVIVATCDRDIYSAISGFGGKVILTSVKHFGCTDRIAEAAEKIDTEIIINVQGDEPTVSPSMIEKLADEFEQSKDIYCANLMMRINKKDELSDSNIIKVVLDNKGYALYFSRAPIPFMRFKNSQLIQFKQTGLYAYKKKFLRIFAKLKPSILEKAEGIDILRVLENGYKIKMKEIAGTLIGVDTPDVLSLAEKFIAKSPLTRLYLDAKKNKK